MNYSSRSLVLIMVVGMGLLPLSLPAEFVTFTDRDEWLQQLPEGVTVDTLDSLSRRRFFGGGFSPLSVGDLTLSTDASHSEAFTDIRGSTQPDGRSNRLFFRNSDAAVVVANGIDRGERISVEVPRSAWAFGFNYNHFDRSRETINVVIRDEVVASIEPDDRFGFLGIIGSPADSFNTIAVQATAWGTFLSIGNFSFLPGANFLLSPSGGPVNQAVNFGYNPHDGSLEITADGLDGLTTTVLSSVNSVFDPSKVTLPVEAFDQNTASKFFKITAPPDPAQRLSFGPGFLPVGMSHQEFNDEIDWSGSIAPRGSWSTAPGGGPYFWFDRGDVPVDQSVSFGYDPRDGSAVLVATGLEGVTTTVIESINALFDPTKVTVPIEGFDQSTASKFFKLTAPPEIASSFDFAPGFLPPGLTLLELQREIRLSGSLYPAGAWSDAASGGPYVFLIPEPSSGALVTCFALPGLLIGRRRTARPHHKVTAGHYLHGDRP